MKYLFIFGIVILFLFNLQKVNAQLKTDTIYYLLDTAKVPMKDRMFSIERESPFEGYVLQCKCFPYGYSIFFYYHIEDRKTKKISTQEFSKIKTVSIMELINLAIKCLSPEHRNKYQFIFAEPEGNHIRLTDMMLSPPYDPRKPIPETTVESMKN